MAAVLPRDVLFRISPRSLEKYQSLAVAGAGRGRAVPLPYTFTRADPSTCATLEDSGGIIRTAAADKVRIAYPTGLVDANGNPIATIRLEGQRTNALDNGSADTDLVGLGNNGLTSLNRVTTSTPAFGAGHGEAVFPNSSGVGPLWRLRSGSRVTASVGQAWAGTVRTKHNGAGAISYLLRLDWYDGASAFISSTTAIISVPVGSTYARYAVRGTAPASTASVDLVCFTNGAQGIFTGWFDLAQLEQAAFESSDIPTNSATVTRAADSLTVPFNFGPLPEITVLARHARPVWADVAGSIGPDRKEVFSLGDGAASRLIEMYFADAARNALARISSVGLTVSASQAIPAGAELSLAAQFKNLTTGGQVALDVGSGYSAFSSAANGFSAFNDQTMRVGFTASTVELYGDLIDLIVLRGLFTRAEALVVSNA